MAKTTGAKGARRHPSTGKYLPSRWPKEAANWNGKQREAFAKKIAKRYPNEDPEYGMPDGSE